jgi:hypothetical protein
VVYSSSNGGKDSGNIPSSHDKQIHTAWRELGQAYWQRDNKQLPSARKLSAIGRVIHGVGLKITIPATKLPTIVEEEEETKMSAEKMEEVSITDDDNDKKSNHRTFCPALYRDPIINMIEKHYCAILKTTMILESQYVSCSLR